MKESADLTPVKLLNSNHCFRSVSHRYYRQQDLIVIVVFPEYTHILNSNMSQEFLSLLLPCVKGSRVQDIKCPPLTQIYQISAIVYDNIG